MQNFDFKRLYIKIGGGVVPVDLGWYVWALVLGFKYVFWLLYGI